MMIGDFISDVTNAVLAPVNAARTDFGLSPYTAAGLYASAQAARSAPPVNTSGTTSAPVSVPSAGPTKTTVPQYPAWMPYAIYGGAGLVALYLFTRRR